MAWITEGAKTNPANGTVLADTGALTEGSLSLKIAVSATVAAMLLVQRRDADNNASVQEFQVRLLTNETDVHDLQIIELLNGERVRIIMGASAIGQVQAMIIN